MKRIRPELRRFDQFWTDRDGFLHQGLHPKYQKFQKPEDHPETEPPPDDQPPEPDTEQPKEPEEYQPPQPDTEQPKEPQTYPLPEYAFMEKMYFSEDTWEWFYWYSCAWLNFKGVQTVMENEAEVAIRVLAELDLGF